MGCCYGGVNTFADLGVGSRFVCETDSGPRRLTLGQSLFLWKGNRPRAGPIAGLQAKKIPAEARSFFVGAQERTRTSTVLPAST